MLECPHCKRPGYTGYEPKPDYPGWFLLKCEFCFFVEQVQGKVKPVANWDLKGSQKLTDPDVEIYARWIFTNMTQKNKKCLKGMTRFYTSWLNQDVARYLAIIVNDRKHALIKAIDKGQCRAIKYPAVSKDYHREVIGAAMCELLHAGELNGLPYIEDFSKSHLL